MSDATMMLLDSRIYFYSMSNLSFVIDGNRECC